MNTLTEIYYSLCAQGYCSDKGDIHSYIEVYEKLLEPYRNGSILEIGIFKGDSLRMWEQYFNEAHGIDCSDQPHGGMADLREMIASGEHNIYIGDATSPEDADKFFKGMKFDVIIDDGSHALQHQLESYRVYSKYLKPNGIYIIEDIQDIESEREIFEAIDSDKQVTIIDNRQVKGRYDDILITIKDKK